MSSFYTGPPGERRITLPLSPGGSALWGRNLYLIKSIFKDPFSVYILVTLPRSGGSDRLVVDEAESSARTPRRVVGPLTAGGSPRVGSQRGGDRCTARLSPSGRVIEACPDWSSLRGRVEAVDVMHTLGHERGEVAGGSRFETDEDPVVGLDRQVKDDRLLADL